MDTPYASRHLTTATSTQDEARLHFDGVPLLVTADRQIAGRGRAGNEWLQAPRAVFASLAFRPNWDPAAWPRLTLVAALAARAAVAAATEPPPSIKWPNDLLDRAGDKVAGLIAESAEGSGGPLVVAGLGINLWWPYPPAGMAALFDDDPGSAAAPAIAAAWARGLLDRTGGPAHDWGRSEYLAACGTVGEHVTWDEGADPAPTGIAVGIDDDGALLVEADGRRRRLISGEVRRLRAATIPPTPPATPGTDA